MQEHTEVYVWGSNTYGQLGVKEPGKTYTIPKSCSFNTLILQVAVGEEHAVFISRTGEVYSIGSNREGRLGVGTHTKQSSSPCLVQGVPPAVHVSCGWGHTVVVTQEATVYTWGAGEFGALGCGSCKNQPTPVQMSLPSTFQAIKGSCGSRHSVIIGKESGSAVAYACGGGEAGQLGTGRREREVVPCRVDFSEDCVEVACGVFHTLFLTGEKKVYSTGGNSFGQLGTGDKKSLSKPGRVLGLEGKPVVKIACGHHSAALTETGELFVWGTGVFGEFLYPHQFEMPLRVIDLGVGGSFGCALDELKDVYVWGANSNGELGVGDYKPRRKPFIVENLSAKNIKTLGCGGSSCFALGNDIEHKPESRERSQRRRSVPSRAKKEEVMGSSFKSTIREKIILEEEIQEKQDEIAHLNSVIANTQKMYKQEINELKTKINSQEFPKSKTTLEELENLKFENKNLQTKNEMLRLELAQVSEDFLETQKEKQELNSTIQKLEKELDSKEDPKEELVTQKNTQIEKLHKEIQELCCEKTQTNKVLTQVKEELETYKAKYKEASEEKATQDKKYKELLESYEALGLDTKASIESVKVEKEEALRKLHESLLQHQNTKQDMEYQINQLTNQNYLLKTEYEKLKSDLSVFEEELRNLHDSNQETENYYKEKLQSIDNELNYSKQENLELKFQIQKLEDQVHSQYNTISDLSRITEDWEQNYNNLQKDNEFLRTKVTEASPESPQAKTPKYFATPQASEPPEFSLSPTRPRDTLSQTHIYKLSNAASQEFDSQAKESPLKKLRISSIGRRSQERPAPFESEDQFTFRSPKTTPSKAQLQARISQLLRNRDNLAARFSKLDFNK